MSKRISDLQAAIAAALTDEIPAASGGDTVKLTVDQLRSTILGAIAAADVSISDAGGYYASNDVEGALQELGPIESTGSNSNGSFVVFSSGIQVCWDLRVLSYVATHYVESTWTFPRAFAVAPTPYASRKTLAPAQTTGTIARLFATTADNESATSVRLRVIGRGSDVGYSGGATETVAAFAIGVAS